MTLLPLFAEDVRINPLNYQRVALATPFARRVVEKCVQETILLFSSHVGKKEPVAFAFGNIGMLACVEEEVHMHFSADCLHRLAKKAGPPAAHGSVSCSGFLGSLDFFGNPLEGGAS